jgi:hypothetical protein
MINRKFSDGLSRLAAANAREAALAAFAKSWRRQ